MRQINLGIVAHADAGKTTLNECFLYHGNIIRKMGRVDNGSSYFDSNQMEKSRGITIFSKTASFKWNDSNITLVDTPGHKDFAGEMERTLQVLDEIVLVVSGLDGVQSHTETVFKLAEQYNLPVFIFVNKMDLTTLTQDELIADLHKKLSNNIIPFNKIDYEKIALSDDELLDEYLKNNTLSQELIKKSVSKRKIFPLYFGSALKDEGIVELLNGIDLYTMTKKYPKEFGLRIFKVFYDNNTRWCYGKVTGGVLKTKQKLTDEEKVDQLYMVSSDKFIPVSEAHSGQIVAIKGLKMLASGSGVGIEKNENISHVKAYMQYRIETAANTDQKELLRQLQMLQQEDPSINIIYQPQLKQYCLSLMGQIQIDVIEALVKQRSNIDIHLSSPRVLYKETISEKIIGYGHFEPLRHYAEVHVLLEPLERNKGIEIVNGLSNDDISFAWQTSIINSLKQKTFVGILTGSEVTDLRITVIRAKGNLKHTDSADFREAVYRAVRNGLKRGNNILLEPYYEFIIRITREYAGKILFDLEKINAQVQLEQIDDINIIKGNATVRLMNDFITEFYGKCSGKGNIDYKLSGYKQCMDSADIISEFSYDSESDLDNPTGSIFCSHGSGFYVPYDYVRDYIHIKEDNDNISTFSSFQGKTVSDAELKKVFADINGRNRNDKKMMEKKVYKETYTPKKVEIKPKLLIVDGYNIIHSYDKTRNMLGDNLEGARDILINDVASYAGYLNCKAIIVFDAYKRAENSGKKTDSGNISIVYTKQGQSADAYIEKTVHDNIKDYRITVATSDQAVQNMVLGCGAIRMSARELQLNLDYMHKQYNK